MNKIFKVADIRKLEQQVSNGEISYSRMVEIMNEMANNAECKVEKLPIPVVMPRFPSKQLHLNSGSRMLNVRGRIMCGKPEIIINCMEYWEPTDEDYGEAEENNAAYFPTISELDDIIEALEEAKVFLNGA